MTPSQISRIKQVLKPVPYKGENDRKEVSRYFDKIYNSLSAVLWEGINIKLGDKWLIKHKIKKEFLNEFDKNNDQAIKFLASGKCYRSLLTILAEERLKAEVGSRYYNKTLKVDVDVVLNELFQLPIAVFKNDQNSNPTIQFNLLSVFFLNTEEKRILLDHEAVQIAAGYVDSSLPDDRRKLKFYADYLTVLLHSNEKPFADILSKISPGKAETLLPDDIEKVIGLLKVKSYEKNGKNPGQDQDFDQRMTEKFHVLEYYLSYFSKLTYPDTTERLEEMLALGPKLRHQEEMLRPFETNKETTERHSTRLREAIKARRIKTDVERGY